MRGAISRRPVARRGYIMQNARQRGGRGHRGGRLAVTREQLTQQFPHGHPQLLAPAVQDKPPAKLACAVDEH